jgi:general stress protein YciG
MTADYRLFIKVHNGFPEHRKTSGLTDRAFRHLIEAWCFCSRNLTDGKLTKPQASKIFSARTLRELADAGWLTESSGEVEMSEYLQHQMSAAQVADLREKRAEAGRRGGEAKANRVASAIANGQQNPSGGVADKDVDIDVVEKTSATATPKRVRHAYPEDFLLFWEQYPKKVGKDAALKAWKAAIQRALPEEIITGAERYARDPKRDPQYTKDPQGWLAAGKWADQPEPARTDPYRQFRMLG